MEGSDQSQIICQGQSEGQNPINQSPWLPGAVAKGFLMPRRGNCGFIQHDISHSMTSPRWCGPHEPTGFGDGEVATAEV